MIQATKAVAVELEAVSANATAVRAGKELAVREGGCRAHVSGCKGRESIGH